MPSMRSDRTSYASVLGPLVLAIVTLVLGGARRLEQVFGNLLGNACKYNRRGGKLTLRLQEERNTSAFGSKTKAQA